MNLWRKTGRPFNSSFPTGPGDRRALRGGEGKGRMKEIESLNTPESERYVYVRELAAMGALVRRIGAAERVALDTEAESLPNYFEKVCLVQLSLGGEHYL